MISSWNSMDCKKKVYINLLSKQIILYAYLYANFARVMAIGKDYPDRMLDVCL